MKRVLLLVAVLVPVVAAAVYSRQKPAEGDGRTESPATTFEVKTEAKNPWTHLRANADPDQFQFLVVTDRTGGHREKIFSKAVHQINLLQPEFVVSVGDLIEGYTQKQDRLDTEWKQFDSFVKTLQMPFFYVPGNHDLANKEQVAEWGGRYGRKYYHFVYRNVLFLAVNSEDPTSRVSDEQAEYFRKALDENPGVKWTMVFLHKPLWTANDLEKNGWLTMEKHLAGRKYTVFCGHVHRYQKFVRNGMNYYQLATTGGGSRLRGPKYGEFDHISWITMKKDGPLIANVLLDGVLPEDLTLPEVEEPGQPRKMLPTEPVKGRAVLAGQPLENATVRFYRRPAKAGTRPQLMADGLTDADGTFQATTYRAFDGVPAGEYFVCVVKLDGYAGGNAPGKNSLPERYADPTTTPLRVEVRPGAVNVFEFNLTP